MRLRMGLALILMFLGLFWTGLVIRAHVWEAYGLIDLSTLFGAGSIWLGAMTFMQSRKELGLTRRGQTPVEGFSLDEYQQLIKLQGSRDAPRARELARQALLNGDRAKALTFVRSGLIGYRFWKWYNPERELAKFEKELSAGVPLGDGGTEEFHCLNCQTTIEPDKVRCPHCGWTWS